LKKKTEVILFKNTTSEVSNDTSFVIYIAYYVDKIDDLGIHAEPIKRIWEYLTRVLIFLLSTTDLVILEYLTRVLILLLSTIEKCSNIYHGIIWN
jgi:hypothetical protein